MTVVMQSVLLLISGIFYPLEVLPGWIQPFAWLSPATYILRGIRMAMIDGAGLADAWPAIWPLLIISVLSLPLGLWVFGASLRYAKRTGRLKRSG